MGVKGLWRLLLPIGRRVSIEVLEGKVLAIDASIWLTQFLKAMRDPESGRVQPAAHLIGFFRRLAKLRYHGIRPVLVFDGATPIIKLRELQQRRQRREQFAPNSEAAFKRMAKRLLIQEIKKSKRQKLSDNTSVAPGFNLPDTNDLKESRNIVGDSIGDAENENPTSRRVDETITDYIIEGNKAITSKLTSLQEEEPRKEEKYNYTLSTQNATLETSEEIARALQEEEWGVAKDDGSDDRNNDWVEEEKEFTAASKLKVLEEKPKEITMRDVGIDHLSGMTSHERKDAIENARRNQRMQSRKEFMPVAGQPEAYSETQLRNFLRSSRLNQSISKVAQEMARKDPSLGDRVAADPSRRIFFEKEDIKGSKLPIVLARKDSSTGDSDSVAEWEEDESDRFESKKNSTSNCSNRSFLILDSSDEEGGGVAANYGEDDGIDICQSGFKGDHEKDQCIKLLEHSSSSTTTSDSSQGGFLKERGHTEKSQISDAKRNITHLQLSIPVSCTNEDRTLHNTEDSKEPIREAKTGFASDVVDDTGPVCEFVTVKADASISSNDGQVNQTHTSPRIASLDEDDIEGSKAELSTSAYINNLKEIGKSVHAERNVHLGIGECEEESIDWVDGDDTSKTSGSSNFNQINKQEILNVKITDPLKSKINKNSSENLGILRKVTLNSEMAKGKESIYLVDGDKTTNSSDLLNHTTNDALSIKDGRNNDDGENFKISHKGEIQSNTENESDVCNVAALQQAQSTAANLTDWAGRAFRRAIAQHAKASFPKSETLNVKSSISPDSGDFDKKEIDLAQGNIVRSKEAGKILCNPGDKTKDNTTAGVEQRKSVKPALKGTVESVSPPHANETCIKNCNDLLAQEERIEQEMKRENRDMDTINDEMKLGIISLIKLFGIPYVDAVSEAEAQCVALEDLGLVDGIVTEDSDAFVFGAKNVYKNIFDDQKFVEVYKAEDALRELGLGRKEMVALAMLLGGDYTDGVKGVGIVNAMEILQVFDTSQNVKSGLEAFRKWLDGFDLTDATGLPCTEAKALSGIESFHKTHKSFRSRWVCPTNFPANDVLNAYLNPVVDKSSAPFSWGLPNVEKLVSFCSLNMGWEASDTRRMLEPIVERLEVGMRQTRLDVFMNYKDNIQFANVRSKRLRNVLKEKQKDQNDESRDK